MAKVDPIERLLSIDDYQEFILTLDSYSVNHDEMKELWKKRRNPEVKPKVSNRSMEGTISKKKVVTETTVSKAGTEEE